VGTRLLAPTRRAHRGRVTARVLAVALTADERALLVSALVVL
jgi:hypothetical protein